MRAVAGITGTVELHEIEAYGLIDNDGMSNAQIAKFEEQGIFPLSIFSIESVYYSEEVRRAVAIRQAGTATADAAVQNTLAAGYLADAKLRSLQVLAQVGRLAHLASRVAERQLRDSLLALLPSREAMVANQIGMVNVALPAPYPDELVKLTEFIKNQNIDAIISRYPVRETPVLDAIAKALRFQNRWDYEAAALTRVASDPELRAQLLKKLAPLSQKLGS